MNNIKLYLNIDDYIKKEIKVSAINLCRYLIENYNYSNELFSTGRPSLYVDVLMYLKKLQKAGTLTSTQKDQCDCKYKLISKDSGNSLLNETENIEKDGAVIEGQLSLF